MRELLTRMDDICLRLQWPRLTRVSRYDPLFKKWRAAPKNGGYFAAAGPNNVRQGLAGRDSEKRKLRAARAGLIDDVNSLIFVGAKLAWGPQALLLKTSGPRSPAKRSM